MLTHSIRKNVRLACAAVLGMGLTLSVAGCTSSSPSPQATEATQPTATVPSPASIYENKLVRRPGTGPEDAKVYLVQNSKRHWVVNASWFAAHGYKFPDQVQEIPAADLDAI